MKTQSLPRRTFLKGLGTAVALPWLEAMRPATRLLAADLPPAAGAPPLRLAFVYVPNGVNMEDWTPQNEGAGFDLPRILQPLEKHRDRFSVLTGLDHRKADANGDGPGDHARASATFLTGCQAHKTAAANIRAGISVDQLAARHVGGRTRLSSLELSCDRGQQAGACDSGYSCAYQFNLAWKTPTLPLPPEVDPRQVFDRLFGGDDPRASAEARARRKANRQSLLDYVLDDAKQLSGRLGKTDQLKLEEYMSSIRDIERSIEREEQFTRIHPDYRRPEDLPENYEAHLRLMFDLLALALQTDSTRVATFMVAHDGSNRSYPFAGVPEGHHDISHHGGNDEKKKKIAEINRFHSAQFAYFLDRLRAAPDGDGTLLDHCMIVYGSGISDGNAHWHHDLPVLLAGGGGGTLNPGRHVRYPGETPMSNLYRSLLDRMGAPGDAFGDSTGRLTGLV